MFEKSRVWFREFTTLFGKRGAPAADQHEEPRLLELTGLEDRLLMSATPVSPEMVEQNGGESATPEPAPEVHGELLAPGVDADDWQLGSAQQPAIEDEADPTNLAEDDTLEQLAAGTSTAGDDDGGFVLQWHGSLDVSQPLPADVTADSLNATQDGQTQVRHELVFVDTQTQDYEQFVEELLASGDDQRQLEVVLLDGQRDGVEQITEVLGSYDSLDAVHVVSHGTDGAVKLGSGWLSMDNISAYTDDLVQWRDALAGDADLLFYGCDLAATGEGQTLLESLSTLCDCDVAASTDDTGSADLGGDWELEYELGAIESTVIVGQSFQSEWQGLLNTFVVTTTNDGGAGSLRQAIIDANALAGQDTITLGAGVYTFTVFGQEEDGALSGDLDIHDDLVITGAGADVTTIDAASLDRVFDIWSGTVTITGVTITGGDASDSLGAGGAFYVENSASLTLSEVIVTNNSADDAGGGIANSGLLTLTNVEISNNTAYSGGGLDNIGSATVSNSTFSNNNATFGGGIRNDGFSADLTLTNVTISGNTATNRGGGLLNNRIATLVNVTIADNQAGQDGGVYAAGGTTSLKNSIVAGNTLLNGTTPSDFGGSVSSQGFNLVGNTSGSFGWVGSDQQNVDPLLGTLADNGGFTQTHALLASSTAIDAGTASGAPSIDQRGVIRDSNVDIGAYEYTLPIANAGGPYPLAEGDDLVLDATGSVDLEGDTLTYKWDLDNDGNYGEPGEPTTDKPTVSWATLQSFGIDDDGSYTIGLQVDDGNGGVNTTTTVIDVVNTAPVLTVTGSGSVDLGRAYTLNLSATDPGDDTITSWTINWGDGTIETIAGNPSSVAHTYAQLGNYNITASATDEDGTFFQSDLIVAEFWSDNITKYDGMTGDALAQSAPRGDMDGPADALVGPDGLLYVSGFSSDTVLRYDLRTGDYVDTLVAAGVGGLDGAAGLAFDQDGNLLVASYETSSVKRYDIVTGDYMGDFVAAGAGGLSAPIGMTYGADGNLYVAGWISNTVVRYDGTTGDFIDVFVSTDLNQATDLEFGPDGHLYVGSHNAPLSGVKKFDGSSGAFLGTTVSLSTSFGFTFGPDGNLYVASEIDDTINVYDTSGNLLRTLSDSGDGLDGPWMMNFTPDQQVTVVMPSNTAPTIALAGGPVNYDEGDGAVVIDSSATASDVDLVDFDTGTLTVDFTANGTAFDRLSIRDEGPGAGNIQVSGSTIIYDSGGPLAPIATFSGGTDGSTPLVITFNSSATATQVQAVMRNVTYENVSENPSTSSRTVRFVLTDGDGGTSNAATETINVTAVNDAPTDVYYTQFIGGSEFVVNSTLTDDQDAPAVTALAGGGFVVVWESINQDGDGDGIYFQRYDNAGSPAGVETQINLTTTSDQDDPQPVALSDGSFVVVWESNLQDGSSLGIFGRQFDATGNPLTGEFQINTTTADQQVDPRVAALRGGGFVVVWESNLQDGDQKGVYSQRFDNSSAPVGVETQVHTTTAGTQADARVAGLNDGGYVVVWESDASGSLEIMGRRFDAGGSPTGGEFQINSTTADVQDDPEVTALVDGGFVVIWESVNQDGSGTGLYGQKYDAAGSSVGSEFQVNSTANLAQQDPAVKTLDDGGFLVVWESFDQDGSDYGVYAQRFDASGNQVHGEFQLNTTTADGQKDVRVDVLGDGRLVTAWVSENQDGSGNTVVGRIFTPTLDEHSPNGTIAAVASQVVDVEAGDTHTFTLVDNAGGAFTINNSTGEITVANSNLIDFEAAATMNVTVRVTDSGSLTHDEVVTIQINNVNDAPNFDTASFTDHTITATADGAVFVHSADVDGDGDIDVLSASGTDDTIAWYENDGSENFTKHTITTTADIANEVTTADVDGDGDLDVLSASTGDSTIAWYENDGSQNFTEHIITNAVNSAQSVATADVDGDGDLDVLSGSAGTGATLAWYENDGSQNFTTHAITTTNGSYRSVITADVDGDGDLDVLSASFAEDMIGWYENDGSGNFTEHTVTTTADGARSVFVVDVDGDGDVDVLSASDNDDKIAWYENDGSQNFTAHTITTTAYGARSVTAADMDRDGDLDVLSASSNDSTLAWYENDGSENFTKHTISNSVNGAYSVAVADVDSDGDLDALSASLFGDTIAWHENTSTTTLDGAPTFVEGGAAVVLDADVEVSDLELDSLNGGAGNYDGASVTLVRNGGANSDDVFSFSDGNGITLVGGNLIKNTQIIATFDTTATPGQLVVTFTDANGEVPASTDVDNILRQITYENSSDTPPTSVQIDWIFDDGNTGGQGSGGALLATGSTTVTVTATNDDPTNTGSLPSDVSVTEDVSSSVDLSTVVFSDVDAGNNQVMVTLRTSTGGRLFASSDLDVTVLGSGFGVMSLTGGVADLNNFFSLPTRFQYLHGTSHTAGDNADTIQLEINDLGNTGVGGGTTIVLGTVNVDITGVNDAPVRTSGTVNNLTVLEDSGLTSLGLSGVSYSTGGGADESAQTLTYEVTVIPDPVFFGQILLADGTTQVTTGFYSLAEIQGMQFKPADNVNGGPSFFSFRVQDSGGTANGGNDAITESIQLNITAVNDAPVVDLSGTNDAGNDFATTFTEDGGPVAVADTDAIVSDVEASTYQALSINVWNTSDGASEKVTVGGYTFSYGVSDVVVRTVGGTTFELDFDGSGFSIARDGGGLIPQADLQALIRGITYENISQDPTAGDRTLEFVAVDDLGLISQAANSVISVVPQNDSGQIDLDQDNSSQPGSDYSTTFVEGGGPVNIADVDAVITDADDVVLNSLTISITNLLDGADEILTADTSGTSILASYDSGTGVLSLTQTDTLANYQQVLRSVTYENLSDNPNTTARIIQVAGSGPGPLPSNFTNVAFSTIGISPENDVPEITITSDPVTYVFASGVFQFCGNEDDKYVEPLLLNLFSRCKKALAVNVLSSMRSESEKTTRELYVSPSRAVAIATSLTEFWSLDHSYHPGAGDMTIAMHKKESVAQWKRPS